MTILLYKDGRLVVNDGNPLEGVRLDGLVVCITDPQEGDVLTYDGSLWVNAQPTTPEPEEGDD